jgi:hypothetical protein
MMVEVTKKIDPLDALAAGIDLEPAASGPEAQAASDADAAQVAQFEKLMAGLGIFSNKVLRALRQRAARNLPELLEHVTDADLQGVSDALPPVLNKHIQKLAPFIGLYPEEAMLLVACVPLAMGYVSALEAHGLTQNKQGAPAIKSEPTDLVLND